MENKDLLSMMTRPGITFMVTGAELLAFTKGLFDEAFDAFTKLNDSRTKEIWLTSAEASQFMGVSVSTLCRWVKRGILHPRRIGANYRFSKSELLAIRDAQQIQIA